MGGLAHLDNVLDVHKVNLLIKVAWTYRKSIRKQL